MTTVSVIIPTYNRARTLGRALTSSFGQTRLPDEVIVVDDGSTDSTTEVVQAFPGARFIRLDTNRGAAHARNTGVRYAQCEYIAFLDSDDVWLANKLEVQLARIAEVPEIGLLCTGITVLERKGSVSYYGAGSRQSGQRLSLDQLQTYPFSTSTWLIKRTTLLDLGLFDESLPNSEDLDLLARMLSCCVIEIVHEPLVVKYNQSDSLNADRAKATDSYAVLLSRHKELWGQAPAAAAKSYQRLANMHARLGEMASARAALRETIRYQPWQLKSWLMLLFSLLGERTYLRLRRIRKRLE